MKSTKQFFKLTLLLILTSFFAVSCSKDLAVVQTMEVTSITETTAVSGGIVTDDKGEVVEARGICWSTDPNPTTNDLTSPAGLAGAGSFVCTMTNLEKGTLYYVRAYAETKNGVAYGSNMAFTTLGGNNPNSVIVPDIDGNNYTTITIGSQTWMTENLKVKRLNDGTPISQLTSDNLYWSSATTEAWGVSRNDNTNMHTYGLLYNWYAVSNPKLAPEGWRVATDEDWTILENSLGGYAAAEAKLKSAYGWVASVGNGSNTSGFNALPGGYNFDYATQTAAFWTTTPTSVVSSAITREYGSRSNLKTTGTRLKSHMLSVRCIKK